MDGANLGSSRTKLKIVNQPAQSGTAAKGAKAESDFGELAHWTMYTPDEELELLFDPKIIPASFRQSLGEGLHVSDCTTRLMDRSDLYHLPI